MIEPGRTHAATETTPVCLYRPAGFFYFAAIVGFLFFQAAAGAGEAGGGRGGSELKHFFLECTANQGISSIGIPNGDTRDRRQKEEERHLAFGGAETFPLRQTQNWGGFETKCILFKFDVSPLAGMVVKKAWLHLAIKKWDIYGAGLCSVYADWAESAGYGRETTGAPCWNWKKTPGPGVKTDPWMSWQEEPEAGRRPAIGSWWAFPGSRFYSVTWMHPWRIYSHAGPGKIVRYADADGNRFVKIPVSPELIEAMISGASEGMVLTDDKGQVAEAYMLDALKTTKFKYSPAFDIQIFSRFAPEGLRPRLEVVAESAGSEKPAAVKNLKIVGREPVTGALWLGWTVGDDSGKSGKAARYLVKAAPLDGGGNYTWPLWETPRPPAAGKHCGMRLSPPPRGTGKYRVEVIAFSKTGETASAKIEVEFFAPRLPIKWSRKISDATAPQRSGFLPLKGNWRAWVTTDLDKIPASESLRKPNRFLPNPVWNAAAGEVNLSAARNETAAFQVIFSNQAGDTRPEALGRVRLSLGDLLSPGGAGIPRENIKVFHLWYLPVKTDSGSLSWQPEVCVPTGGEFPNEIPVPDAGNFPKDVKVFNSSAWVDIYVPKGAAPGEYTGKMLISLPGGDDNAGAEVELKLRLRVRPFELPDADNWPVELNTYSWIGFPGAHIRIDAARYMRIERNYYRLAHEHRCCLNILPYSQSGTFSVATVPALAGDGADIRISDWKEFDGRYGPLLDGSAFTPENGYHGPGEGRPLEQFYLPFHEKWPLDIDDYYADAAPLPSRLAFAEWAKRSGVETSFTGEYKAGFKKTAAEFAAHFAAKKWTETKFQFFMNNKYYWKTPFFFDHGTRGSSYWLLDEPVDYDDYAANKFFLGLCVDGWKEAGAPEVKSRCRVDISQPWMARDMLDRVNLWNSSWLRHVYQTAIFTQRFSTGRDWWSYGGGPKITDDSGINAVRACLLRYTWGTAGELSHWNNIGRLDDWRKPNDLAILYPGYHYAGSERIYDGAIPSLRLKIMRRAQQDVEYLLLLEEKTGLGKDGISALLAAWAGESGKLRGSYSLNAVTERSVFELRDLVEKTLSEKH